MFCTGLSAQGNSAPWSSAAPGSLARDAPRVPASASAGLCASGGLSSWEVASLVSGPCGRNSVGLLSRLGEASPSARCEPGPIARAIRQGCSVNIPAPTMRSAEIQTVSKAPDRRRLPLSIPFLSGLPRARLALDRATRGLHRMTVSLGRWLARTPHGRKTDRGARVLRWTIAPTKKSGPPASKIGRLSAPTKMGRRDEPATDGPGACPQEWKVGGG